MIYLCSNTLPANLGSDIVQLKLTQIKFESFSIDFSAFDAVIFSSKHALIALKQNDILPTDLQVFAIGEASARVAKDFGFKNVFEAKNHHGDDFAREIAPMLKNKKTLFVRAKELVSNLDKILIDRGINLTQIVAYSNEIVINSNLKAPEEGAIIVFTSPKNVQAFRKNFGWKSAWKAVAIGKATAKALSKFCEPVISDKQDINACLELAKSLTQI